MKIVFEPNATYLESHRLCLMPGDVVRSCSHGVVHIATMKRSIKSRPSEHERNVYHSHEDPSLPEMCAHTRSPKKFTILIINTAFLIFQISLPYVYL